MGDEKVSVKNNYLLNTRKSNILCSNKHEKQANLIEENYEEGEKDRGLMEGSRIEGGESKENK